MRMCSALSANIFIEQCAIMDANIEKRTGQNKSGFLISIGRKKRRKSRLVKELGSVGGRRRKRRRGGGTMVIMIQ